MNSTVTLKGVCSSYSSSKRHFSIDSPVCYYVKDMILFSKVPAILIDSENVGSTWISLLQNDEKFELYICVTENAKSLNFSLLKQLTDEHRYKINIIECQPGKNSLDFYLSSYLGYLIGKGKHSSYTVVSQDTGYDGVIEYWRSEGYDVKRINTKPETPKKTARRSARKNAEPKAEPKKEERKSVKEEAKPEVKVNSETRIILKDKSKEVQENKKSEAPKKKQTTKKADKPKKQETPKADEASKLIKQLLKDYPENEVEDVMKYLNKVPAEKRSDRNYIYRGLVRKFKSEKGLAIYTLIKKDLEKYYQLNAK